MLKFITGNKNKFWEIQRVLEPIKIGRADIDLHEIQELDPYKVIEHKLREALDYHTRDFFIEDTSVVFLGLSDNLPGTFIKFFLAELKDVGLAKLAKRLSSQKYKMRTIIAYAESPKKIHYFEGTAHGTIVSPKGTGGFGLDPILKPAGWSKTLGQLKALNKYETSTRYKASLKFRSFLLKNGYFNPKKAISP